VGLVQLVIGGTLTDVARPGLIWLPPSGISGGVVLSGLSIPPFAIRAVVREQIEIEVTI
jgi:hypothetical protein